MIVQQQTHCRMTPFKGRLSQYRFFFLNYHPFLGTRRSFFWLWTSSRDLKHAFPPHEKLYEDKLLLRDSLMTPRLMSLQVKARGPKLRGLGKKGGLGGSSTPGRRGICHPHSLPPPPHQTQSSKPRGTEEAVRFFFFFIQEHHESQFPEPAILKGLGSQEPKWLQLMS